MRKIHIFKKGLQTSSAGFEKEFTDSDILGMVSSFNPKLHEPPVRVGHEDSDKVPSFGWVKSVSNNPEGNLYAEVDFTPEMEDMIQKGHYKKVSASFYSPDSPVNPNKGFYTLKHIALLGGVAPAVKGLEPFGFSENKEVLNTMTVDLNVAIEEEKIVAPAEVSFEEGGKDEDEDGPLPEGTVEEEEDDEDTEDEIEVKVPSKMKKKAKVEEKPSFSEEEKKALELRLEEMEAKFTEASAKEAEAVSLQTRLAEMEAKFTEMEEAKLAAEAIIKEERMARRREVLKDQVEALYSEGQMTDGIYAQSALVEFAVGLEEGNLDFAEGESAATTLIRILSSIPAPVSFSEVAPETEEVFSEAKPEEEEVEFSVKVEKYAQEKGLTFEAALRELA